MDIYIMEYAAAIAFLEKYAAGHYSEAEHRAFVKWLTIASSWELEDVLDRAMAQGLSLPAVKEADAHLAGRIEAALDEYDAVNDTGQSGRPIHIPIRRLTRLTAAAALIILAGATWWFIARRHDKEMVETVAATPLYDVAPGGNKAILTLANGRQIILDSAANGRLAMQGSTNVIKTDSGLLTYRSMGKPADASLEYNTLTTPRGGQYQLILPDGTKVWLNAASSITYPTAFTGIDRSVEISGEAYFEVAENPLQPFKVRMRDMAITVLGTHFNVNAYPDEDRITTTILEGAVKVQAGRRAEVLRVDDQAKLSPGNGDLRVTHQADVAQAVAWKNGLFAFNDADLPTVMKQLVRWYNVEVEYAGAIPKREFTGEIGKSLTLDQVLKGLTKTDVNYKIVSNNKIIILP